MKQIQAKIIRIIDTKNVVINVGVKSGVENGDIFQIYQEGKSIFDPDTKEDYGIMDYIKAEIIADTIYEKMTICSSRNFRQSYFLKVISGITNPFPEVQADLMVDPSEILGFGTIDPCDPIIRVGDLVRLKPMPDEEQED